jgi:hypothetical protein
LATVPELLGRARKWSFDLSGRMQSPKRSKGHWDINGTVVGPVWDSVMDPIAADDHIPLGQRTAPNHCLGCCLVGSLEVIFRGRLLVACQLKADGRQVSSAKSGHPTRSSKSKALFNEAAEHPMCGSNRPRHVRNVLFLLSRPTGALHEDFFRGPTELVAQ